MIKILRLTDGSIGLIDALLRLANVIRTYIKRNTPLPSCNSRGTMEDNRTFWELSFTETGLTEAQRRATALEEGFNKIKAAADAAARNTGSNFSSLLQPMSAAEAKQRALKEELAKSNELLKGFTTTGKSALTTFASVAAVALGAVVVGATAAGAALSKLDDLAVKAFGERTATLRAYTTILGDSKQAQIEYAKANELASKTELTSAATIKAQQALIVAGFRGADLTNALTASMDIAATKQPAERELTMERMGRAFSQILAAGKLRGQELNQLAEAGVNRGQVLEILGKGNAAAGEKAISGGQVSAQAGIAAVQQSILQTLGTKQLGQFATGAAGSLTGLLSNREEAMDLLLKSFEGESLPAVIRYKEALTEQTNALTTSTETGHGLVMMLSDFESISMNAKTMWTDFITAFMESFVGSYNEARKGSGAFIAMTDGVQILGQTLGKVGTVVGVLADGFEGFMEIMQPISAYISQFIESMIEATKNLFIALDELKAGNYKGFKQYLADAGSSFTSGFATIEFDEKAARERRAAILEKSQEAARKAEEKGAIPESAVKTKWAAGGGKGLQGYDITDLLGGGSGGGSSRSLQNDFSAMVSAAGAVSSAPSAKAASSAAGSDSLSGTAGAASTHITIEPGAFVINGVSDPHAAAEEAYRMFAQRIGRVARAPGVRVL